MNVDGRQPEWDALISALRDGNNDRYMKGYGGQPYVRNSEVVRTADARQRSLADWFEQALYRYVPAVRLPIVGWDELYAWHGQSAGRPPPNKPAGEIEPGGFPLLPVITAIIKIEKG